MEIDNLKEAPFAAVTAVINNLPVGMVMPYMGLQSNMAGLRAQVGSSRVDLQACKLEYSIVSPK